ncbi:MAG: transposase [Bacteroidetes bacterium]|nr:transposase [Bacteroidota bacterium]
MEAKIIWNSAYSSEDITGAFEKHKIKPQINKRGYRYKQLTEKDKLRNHKLSSKRCRVEHIFGAIKQKSGQIIRAVGQERVKAKVVLRLICYNLCRGVHLIKNKRKGSLFIVKI